jgi:predicted metal-dependent hydrolase
MMVENPILLAFVKDLNFSIRIENAAQKQGFEVKFIESAGQIAPEDNSNTDRLPVEPLLGRSGILLDKITRWQPALIIFDLGNDSIPAINWITFLTSGSATRGLPILCYGSHVDVQTITAAKKAGADEVVARSRFVTSLPELIRKHAKVIDLEALEATCTERLPDLAIQGLEKFNRGEYFEAHELLELAWREDHSPGRELYQAIIQVSVAYYQILLGNYNGAAKMFLRLRKWLDPLPDSCRGINIGKLRQDVRAINQELITLGPENITELDRSMMNPVEYQVLN